MIDETPRPAGLRPTLRQLAIVVAWSAILCAAIRSLVDWDVFGNGVDSNCLNAAFLVAGWPVPLLMAMLFLLDRRGPVRGWYIFRCLAAWGLVSGVAFLLADPACWVITGRPTMVFPLLPLFGLASLAALPSAWKSVGPRHCARCGRMSVITVAARFARTVGRIDTGWCAACGARYERDGVKGTWMMVGG